MAEEVIEVFERFFWSLGQVLFIGFPLGMSIVVAVSVIVLVICARKMPREKVAGRNLKLLLVLPVFWVFLGFWGAAFPYHWGSGEPKNPDWMIWIAEAAVVLFLINWALLLVFLKGARVVTFLFGLWNFYFVLTMGLIAAMSLSGNWI